MQGCTPRPISTVTPATPVTARPDNQIVISPISRSQAALKAELTVEKEVVVQARIGAVMYRDFENILIGRAPLDAVQLTQRVNGLSSVPQALASTMALEQAMGVQVTTGARALRNLMLCSDFLQAHIFHFHQQVLPDFLPAPHSAEGGTFLPAPGWRGLSGPQLAARAQIQPLTDLRLSNSLEGALADQYLEALEIRRDCQGMTALLGGRSPHPQSILPGGVTESPTEGALVIYQAVLAKIRAFIEQKYLPRAYALAADCKDLFSLGQSLGLLFSYGLPQIDGKGAVFKRGIYAEGKESGLNPSAIRYSVAHSWLDGKLEGANFRQSVGISPDMARAALDKPGAYSFLPAMRIGSSPMETGPAARMWLSNPVISTVGQKIMRERLGLTVKNFRDQGLQVAFSIMGRHLARAEEAFYLSGLAESWLKAVKPGEKTFTARDVPGSGEGLGLVEGPEGALLHYLRIHNRRIDSYRIITPAMWNASPRDALNRPGPLEQALEGVAIPDKSNPLNAGRVIRAFGV